MDEKKPQIFLSYAPYDEPKVRELYRKLKTVGFKPWMVGIDLLPGEKATLITSRSIRQSDFFVMLLSANSVNQRGELQKEIRVALDIWLGMLQDDIYLIPACLEECEIPKAFEDLKSVDLSKDLGFSSLVQAICEGAKRRGLITEEEQTKLAGVAFEIEDKERRALEQTKAEAERIAKERAEQEWLERERAEQLSRENAEREQQELKKAEQERRKKERQLTREKKQRERLAHEQAEAAKLLFQRAIKITTVIVGLSGIVILAVFICSQMQSLQIAVAPTPVPLATNVTVPTMPNPTVTSVATTTRILPTATSTALPIVIPTSTLSNALPFPSVTNPIPTVILTVTPSRTNTLPPLSLVSSYRRPVDERFIEALDGPGKVIDTWTCAAGPGGDLTCKIADYTPSSDKSKLAIWVPINNMFDSNGIPNGNLSGYLAVFIPAQKILVNLAQIDVTAVRSEDGKMGMTAEFKWNPGGTRVVYHSSHQNKNPELYLVDLATQQVFRLTDNPGEDYDVIWQNNDLMNYCQEKDGKYTTMQVYWDGSGKQPLYEGCRWKR